VFHIKTNKQNNNASAKQKQTKTHMHTYTHMWSFGTIPFATWSTGLLRMLNFLLVSREWSFDWCGSDNSLVRLSV